MSNALLIGGHVSAAGGVKNAPERAAAIGANCLQLFVSPPQGWRQLTITDEQVVQYRANCEQYGIEVSYVHALYLLNLATDDRDLAVKSVDALTHALTVSARLGVAAVAFHTGSYKQRDRSAALADVVERVRHVLQATPPESILAVENSAGEADGHKVGGTFEELAELIDAVNSPRFQLCLDVQHAFGAGYDVRTEPAVAEAVATLDRTIGAERVAFIHANDSKVEFGSHRDRHENIGDGLIGVDGFRALLHHPKLGDKAWILEVPGIDGQSGPDAENVRRLQQLFK